MHILLTAISLAALLGCFLAYMRADRSANYAESAHRRADGTATYLKSERHRVTTLEREVDALRRELRKLSGKFYASQREDDDTPLLDRQSVAGVPMIATSPFCENYGQAQIDGPTSEAASCECGYCVEMRARRDQFRRATVPKTVRGQAELAKLNAGKQP